MNEVATQVVSFSTHQMTDDVEVTAPEVFHQCKPIHGRWRWLIRAMVIDTTNDTDDCAQGASFRDSGY
ncbi:MAG: hypothetical protein LAP21_25285 [Acidobacteriia bacterium]|nr:hypothetical protein [Terriglobia bacterium]